MIKNYLVEYCIMKNFIVKRLQLKNYINLKKNKIKRKL